MVSPVLNLRKANPIRQDPTGTARIRDGFTRDMLRRFAALKRSIRQLLVDDDAFGLKPHEFLSFNAEQSPYGRCPICGANGVQRERRPNGNDRCENGHEYPSKDAVHETHNARQYSELTNEQKLEAFRVWLLAEIGDGILTVSSKNPESVWWYKYIADTYKKGFGKAYDASGIKKILAEAKRDIWFQRYGQIGRVSDFYAGTKEEFLRSAFSQTTTLERIKFLSSRTYTDLQGVTDAMSAQMSRVLMDGLVAGDNPRVIAKNMIDRVDKIGVNRAKMVARTECLTANTIVDAAVVRAVFRRWYEGDIVKIVTRNGREFTTTPNHPMLTQDGWVSSGLLNDSHYLVCNRRDERSMVFGDVDIDKGPSTIGEIFESLSRSGVREWRHCSEFDFHGDGRDCDVDVFCADGELLVGRFSPLAKPACEDVLSESGLAASLFCSYCGAFRSVDKSVSLFRCPQCDASIFEPNGYGSSTCLEGASNRYEGFSGVVSGGDIFDVNIVPPRIEHSSLLPRKRLCDSIAPGCSVLSENSPDRLLVGSDGGRHLPLRHSAEIEVDQVLFVVRSPFNGHVFNLETPYGYFNIDGAYTGNTIRTHAEGQLDAFESLNIEEVGIAVEWSVSGVGVTGRGNLSPCERCAPMKGVVLKIKEARGMIPLHPNCMCSWVPINLEQDRNGQVRDYNGIQSAIRKSLKAELPKRTKRTIAEQRQLTGWAGARGKISKRRPKGLY